MGTPFHQLPASLQAKIIAAQAKQPIPDAARMAMENATAGMGDAFKPKFGFIMDPAAPTKKKRIRQHQGDGMNKTERAYMAHLKATFPNAVHHSQTFSLRLANGSNYRPDFISVWTLYPASEAGSATVRLSAWETKGFKREASAVRIKVAASLFPWIKFHLVTKKKKREGGGWDVQEIIA